MTFVTPVAAAAAAAGLFSSLLLMLLVVALAVANSVARDRLLDVETAVNSVSISTTSRCLEVPAIFSTLCEPIV